MTYNITILLIYDASYHNSGLTIWTCKRSHELFIGKSWIYYKNTTNYANNLVEINLFFTIKVLLDSGIQCHILQNVTLVDTDGGSTVQCTLYVCKM